MSVGFVKSFAALLVGTGLTMAQPPAPTGSAQPPATPPAVARPQLPPPAAGDVRYPAVAGQQGYLDPLPAEVPGGLAVPEGGFGGVALDAPIPAPYRVWGEAEFLLWNIRNPSLPPITSTVPAGVINITQTDNFVPPAGGAATVVNTNFLIPVSVVNIPTVPSSNSIDMGEHPGVRARLGFWIDPAMDKGVELEGFILDRKVQNFRNTTANAVNQTVLNTGLANRTFVLPAGAPGGTTSGAQLVNSSAILFPATNNSELIGSIWTEFGGLALNFRTWGYHAGPFTFGYLCGVRYLQFEEGVSLANRVSITNLTVPGAAGIPAATFLPLTYQTLDDIRTHNYIIAPQIGVKGEGHCWGVFLSGELKVAVGANIQEIETVGRLTQTGGGAQIVNNLGGLLSGPSDQLDQMRTRISVVPEVNLKLGKCLGDWCRLWIGYDALYMQHVIRPGQQTTFTTLNSSISLGTGGNATVTQPTIRFRDLDVWVQGINFGLELKY